MPEKLWPMPVANRSPLNGATTVVNCDGCDGRRRRQVRLRLDEQRLVDGRVARRRRRADVVRRRADLRDAAEVDDGAVARDVVAGRAARGCRRCRSPARGTVRVAGRALVDRLRRGRLALPDRPLAAVGAHVDGRVPDARAARLVDGAAT